VIGDFAVARGGREHLAEFIVRAEAVLTLDAVKGILFDLAFVLFQYVCRAYYEKLCTHFLGLIDAEQPRCNACCVLHLKEIFGPPLLHPDHVYILHGLYDLLTREEGEFFQDRDIYELLTVKDLARVRNESVLTSKTIDQLSLHSRVLSSGESLQMSFSWCQRDVLIGCSPASGSFSLTILIVTPVTLPMISA